MIDNVEVDSFWVPPPGGCGTQKGESHTTRIQKDEKNDVALSKYIIVSGIPFDDKFIYRGDFKNTFIKKFMDKYLAKDIECSIIKDKLIKNIENKSYDFDSIFEDAIKKMNDINESEKPKIMTLK